ncbi:MAG TPA: hypothetical protein VIH76_02985 [Candidatus Acidoferrales bacterium]
MTMQTFLKFLRLSLSAVLALAITASPVLAVGNTPILDSLTTISTVASTVPGNGDVNPYGMIVVPKSVGSLIAGHILVSNFNNSMNLQGTGTTIMDMAPDGSSVNVFAQIDPTTLPGSCPGGVGLTTALVILQSGWVVVGSLPTSDGTSATAHAGCLIVLDSNGSVAETISGSLINGPWDMTSFEIGNQAALFVTNVLNGTVSAGGAVVNEGTVVRVNLRVSENEAPVVEAMTVIASGFGERTDPAALVVGPTGVALSAQCNPFDEKDCAKGASFPFERALYVADTVNNRIAVIPAPLLRNTSAGKGVTLTTGGTLNAPLGLVVAPNGHLITVNGDDGFATEITAKGTQVASELLDSSGGPPPGNGALFGLVFDGAGKLFFVDDATNTLNLLN